MPEHKEANFILSCPSILLSPIQKWLYATFTLTIQKLYVSAFVSKCDLLCCAIELLVPMPRLIPIFLRFGTNLVMDFAGLYWLPTST